MLTIHCDADQVAPFLQGTLLHEALDRCGVTNELHVVRGKRHGDFDQKEMEENLRIIWNFLNAVGVFPVNPRN